MMLSEERLKRGERFYFAVSQIIEEHDAQLHGHTIGNDAAVLLQLLDLIFNLTHAEPMEEENIEYATVALVARKIIKNEPGSDDEG